MGSHVIRRRPFVPIILFALLIIAANHLFFGERHDSATQLDISDDIDKTARPIVPVEPEYMVVIDPGHGGRDIGAEGAKGRG